MDQNRPFRGPARIADVARIAGVSKATVSRVLTRPGMVADETREKVLEAVEATSYRVNHAARNLRKQRTGAVVALLPNLGNPFFARIIGGMGRVLGSAGYDLLVADTQGEGVRSRAVRRFLDPSRADGVILLDGLVDPDSIAELVGRPPVVLACEWIDGSDLPRVIIDNAKGAELAARHLAELGHSRIACLGGPERNVLHHSRITGVERVFGMGGFRVLPGDFTLESGVSAAEFWRSLEPDDRPTGVIAFSDEMACGFIGDLAQSGFGVPRDVSVIGFDDIELAAHLVPALTTVHQPKEDIGSHAAGAILGLIEGREVPAETVLAARLMVRASTAAPPA